MSVSDTTKKLFAAKADAAKQTLSSFSDLQRDCPLTSSTKEKYLRGTSSEANPFAAPAIHHPKIRFVAVNSSNQLTILHSIQPTSLKDVDPTLFAVEGDDLYKHPTVLLKAGAFNQVTVVVAREGDISELGLSVVERSPLECTNANRATEKDNSNSSADQANSVNPTDKVDSSVTIEDLGFNSSSSPDAPVFALVPTTFPLAPGEGFYLEGHNIRDDIPTDKVLTTSSDLQKWLKSIRLTMNSNGAMCNSKDGSIFSPEQVASETPDEVEIGANPTAADVPSQVLTKVKKRLVSSIHTEITPVHQVPAPAEKDIELAILAKYESLIPTQVSPPPSIHRTPSFDNERYANSIVECVMRLRDTEGRPDPSSTLSSTAQANSANAILKYRALFSRTGTDENGTKVLVLATASEAFKTIMAETTRHERRRQFLNFLRTHQENLRNAATRGHATYGWARDAKFDLQAVSDAFCTQFFNCAWMAEPFEGHTGAYDKELSLLCFLPPDTKSKLWTDFVGTQESARLEDIHETDTKKHQRKAKNLYVGGHIATPDDLIQALSNFLLFASLILSDAAESDLFKLFAERLILYQSNDGIRLLPHITQSASHLPFNLLMDNQRVLTHYLRNLPNDPVLMMNLSKGNTILAADTVDKLRANAHSILSTQSLLFMSGMNTHYTTPHETLRWFNSTRLSPPADTKSSTKRNNSPTQPTADPKKAKKNESSNKQNEPDPNKVVYTPEQEAAKKAEGYFIQVGNGKKARPRHKFSKDTGAKESFCNGHMYVGLVCYQKTCNRYHPPLDWNSIPEADQNAITTWVDSCDRVTWADGKKPSSLARYNLFDSLSPMCISEIVPIPVLTEETNRMQISDPESPTEALYPAPTLPPTPVTGTIQNPLPVTRETHTKSFADPFLSSTAPRSLSDKELTSFANSLPDTVRVPLDNPHGKTHTNISFTGDVCFRHVIPHLINSQYCDKKSLQSLGAASPLVTQYQALYDEYMHLDTSSIRGYTMYKNARSETTLNPDRIRLSTAALLQCGCNVEKFIRYIHGPHLATHRNVPRILHKLRFSCTSDQLKQLKRIYTYGAPTKINAHNTEDNLRKYYDYGNHVTVDKNPDIFRKVLVKDSRRGNVVVLKDSIFAFMPHTHLTPQGLADIDNKWKKPRTIFDSSYQPDVLSHAINDWTNKRNEPEITYVGSFIRFLTDIWNLRISYPDEPIYMGDDDVTNAFRLIKTNPAVVGMHCYRFEDHLIIATGQTFGDSFSPANFEPAAVCRQHHARWLWEHLSDETMLRADTHLQNIQLIPYPPDSRPFAKANKDRYNPGFIRKDGSRRPPTYPMQVDDCLYADVASFFPRTVAASVIALEDVFDGHHPFLDPPLSLEKLDPVHHEHRLLLGHYPDTRSMVVKLSPRRKEKILDILESEQWLASGKSAPIRDIAAIIGLLGSACEFFPWGRAQLLLLYSTLADAIRSTYEEKKQSINAQIRINKLIATIPNEMAYRLRFLPEKWISQALWRTKTPIPIPDEARRGIVTFYKYLKSNQPWEQPIGHIIPREPEFVSSSDASHKAIGVAIPRIRAWCLLPYSKELCDRIASGDVHINELEFVGLLIAYIMVLEAVDSDPDKYSPHPVMISEGDNTTANAWLNKMSTKSVTGQNLVKLFAEYQLLSPVGISANHIAGKDNVVADTISRPDTLFSPQLTSLHSIPYPVLINQVCQQYKAKRLWRLFLPSAEFKSLLASLLCSVSTTEQPKRPKNSGRFVPVASISSSGQKKDDSSISYFL